MMMHVSLGLAGFAESVKSDCACSIRLNSSLDCACLSCLKNIQNYADFYACYACLERLNSSLDYVYLGSPKSAQN